MAGSLFGGGDQGGGASGGGNSITVFTNTSQRSQFDIAKLANNYRHRDLGWTIPEAYLALLFMAADADGKFNPEERAQIEMVARRAPALRALMERGELGPHEQSALRKIKANKQQALDEACATLSAEMCLSVFAHCVDLMLSDGEFLKAEADWIDELYPKLDISEEYARRVLEVLLLKGRF